MSDMALSRRALGFGAAGAAALISLQKASAQTMESGGDWLAMIKQQHQMIVQTLDRILATTDSQGGERSELTRRLGYLLTAHSVAEENVIYPALTKFGMTAGSDQLYMEQAHAKVMNADLVMTPKTAPQWLQEVQTLKTALIHHAKDEEEADLFPRLMQAAGPQLNARLTRLYAQQFQSVQPT